MTLRWGCIKCGTEVGGSSLTKTVFDEYRGGYCSTCGKGDSLFRIVLRPEPIARARTTDPETSHAAAASVSGIRASQQVILDLLRERGPATDEDVAGWLEETGRPFSLSGARTRRSELVTAGLVVDSKERRRMRTGRYAIIWEAVR